MKSPPEVLSRFPDRAEAVLGWLLLLLAVAWAIRCWVWMPTLIIGESMVPGLRPGHLASLNKTAYWFHAPQRGDTVFIGTGKELLVKRLIALPGEMVEVINGSVYIEDRQLAEPYVVFGDHSNLARSRVPPGRYLVAGDNRRDSRFALVRRDRIVGRQGSSGAPGRN